MNNNILSQNKNQVLKSQSKYKNIIFDLGGVLLHFKPAEILRDLFGLAEKDAATVINHVSSPVWLDMDRGFLSPEQVAEKLSGSFGKENMIRYLHEISNRLSPIPQGIEILNQVSQKGYKTYILSNLSEFCHVKIKDYDFIQGFDGAIFSYQHGCAKPDEQIYRVLLNNYSLKAEECLFIDDLPVNVDGSKRLGIDGIICKDHKFVMEVLTKLKVL